MNKIGDMLVILYIILGIVTLGGLYFKNMVVINVASSLLVLTAVVLLVILLRDDYKNKKNKILSLRILHNEKSVRVLLTLFFYGCVLFIGYFEMVFLG